MNSFAEVAGDGTSTRATPQAARTTSQTLVTLVRREFWEHRSLWLVPTIVAAVLVACALFGHINIDADDIVGLVDRDQKVALFTIVQWAVAAPVYVSMLMVLTFYLLDCLYAERKDRSILFWKSLPVSDGLTVLSKVLVACLVVPLGVFLLTTVEALVGIGLFSLRLALEHRPAMLAWDTVQWLRADGAILVTVLIGVLWYSPIAACLLLISAASRRAPPPMVWATVPPILAPIIERVAFGTHYIWSFEQYRTVHIWQVLDIEQAGHIVSPSGLRPLGQLLSDFDFGPALSDASLWLGVVAAAAMVYAAVRIRRYRDDT
jgi:ABC-2 type transport system permease protein